MKLYEFENGFEISYASNEREKIKEFIPKISTIIGIGRSYLEELVNLLPSEIDLINLKLQHVKDTEYKLRFVVAPKMKNMARDYYLHRLKFAYDFLEQNYDFDDVQRYY